MVEYSKTYVDVEISIVNIETVNSLFEVHVADSVGSSVVVINHSELCIWCNGLDQRCSTSKVVSCLETRACDDFTGGCHSGVDVCGRGEDTVGIEVNSSLVVSTTGCRAMRVSKSLASEKAGRSHGGEKAHDNFVTETILEVKKGI